MSKIYQQAIFAVSLTLLVLPCASSARMIPNLGSVLGASTQCPNLTRNLSFGSRGQDVVSLQNFLIAQGHLASGNNTGSPSTNGYGAVGPRTRAAIALSCRTSVVAPPILPPGGISPPVGIVNPNSPLIPPSCTPLSPQTQTLSCPTGQIGVITQTRTSSCPGPIWGVWETIANTCTQAIRYDFPESGGKYLLGANINLYKACEAPTAVNNGIDDRWILQDYAKPGVRNTTQSNLTAMRQNGIESLRVIVSVYAGAPGRHDGVLSMVDSTEKALLLSNIGLFTQDAKTAGFKRLSISFNTLGLNSPLDYVRRWTLPATCTGSVAPECQTPPFASARLQENFDFEMAVRTIAKNYESSDFLVLLDLMNEANTSLTSTDPNARAYVETFWRKYVEGNGDRHNYFTQHYCLLSSRIAPTPNRTRHSFCPTSVVHMRVLSMISPFQTVLSSK